MSETSFEIVLVAVAAMAGVLVLPWREASVRASWIALRDLERAWVRRLRDQPRALSAKERAQAMGLRVVGGAPALETVTPIARPTAQVVPTSAAQA